MPQSSDSNRSEVSLTSPMIPRETNSKHPQVDGCYNLNTRVVLLGKQDGKDVIQTEVSVPAAERLIGPRQIDLMPGSGLVWEEGMAGLSVFRWLTCHPSTCPCTLTLNSGQDALG